MSEKKYIIFTDLKDFTYKNALLTDSQISEILGSFEKIVEETAQSSNINIIKSIGDAYFSVGENPEDAFYFAQTILQESQKYDAMQRIDVKKISLRVTITYGDISQHTALNLEDYFGEAINL